ncbi:hypothetical protein [Cryptosporangium arvum]|uniref:hypothetical protein n=1 Tax=Cryptosporangium arvum TaxID=80871 RepID=UPI0004B97211|nr:hypothetical protein [Cryptosporangium arvum]
MDYAVTLEVVRLAEQFHERFDEARRAARFDGLAEARRRAAAALPQDAELMYRRLTSLQCLTARPDLAEHFMDGTLID